MSYVPTIGLEIHVQLNTKSKMFCSCSTVFGAGPNTHVCPVCLGYPGAMPTMNTEALRLTVLSGLMLGCEIPERSKFDRKSYFYPDMPKNYQISQYDMPLCLGGGVDVERDGGIRRIGLTRIHLEEDVAKSMHFAGSSGVDFNRAGVPLMEIVTDPDMHSPEEAFAFLQTLRTILLYAGVSECNLEEGNMRCDVNCSVAFEGAAELGTKTELKNLNTFRGVLNALRYEADRQIDVCESGGCIAQETRRWDPDQGITSTMRTKEDAHDYRYFPEPDLMPVVMDPVTVEAWRASLPELPSQRRERFMESYGLPAYDAGVLVADKTVSDFFDAAAQLSRNPKGVSNWVMTELLRVLSESESALGDLGITPQALVELVELADTGAINSTSAKEVFGVLCAEGGEPGRIVAERGLAQVSDSGAIETFVDEAIEANPKSVSDFQAGKTKAAKFLVGQVMRLSKGKANPQLVEQLIVEKLSAG